MFRGGDPVPKFLYPWGPVPEVAMSNWIKKIIEDTGGDNVANFGIAGWISRPGELEVRVFFTW